MKSKFLHQSVLFFLLFVLLIPLSSAGQKKSIILSEETVRQFSIVVYDDNSVIQQAAAKELQTYLKKLFNFGPPIRSRKKIFPAGPYFYLGEGFVRDSLFKIDTLPKDAFVKAFQNGNIYLGGKDDLDAISVIQNFQKKADKANFGTLYAVYDFLENDLGIHWFFPTNLGEFVPSQISYSIKEQGRVIKPVFIQRTFSKTLYHDTEKITLWMLRNKVSYLGNTTLFKHNWKNIVPPDIFFDTVPAVFANINGQHKKHSKNNRPAQLCTTNEKALQLFVKQSKLYLKTHPKVRAFSLSPNDNKEFCECQNCKGLDDWQSISGAYSRMSCRIFSFYKTIYDSIIEEYPNIKMGGFAYKEFSVACQKVKLPEDFHIRLAVNNIGFGNSECSTLDTLFMIIHSWKEKNNTGFYCYPYGNTWVFPYLKSGTYQKLIKELAANNFYQVRFHFYPDWYTQGLDVWLISKMLWNPDVNLDSLKTLYYHSVYPKTFNTIQSFHNALEQKITDLNICVPSYSPGKKRLKEIFAELFTEGFLKGRKKQMEEALKWHEISPNEKENVSNIIKMLDFLILEQNANSLNFVQRMLFDDETKMEDRNKILSLKNTLILSGKSIFWDTKRSVSFYIQN